MFFYKKKKIYYNIKIKKTKLQKSRNDKVNKQIMRNKEVKYKQKPATIKN